MARTAGGNLVSRLKMCKTCRVISTEHGQELGELQARRLTASWVGCSIFFAPILSVNTRSEESSIAIPRIDCGTGWIYLEQSASGY
jgi:hypothetical protein